MKDPNEPPMLEHEADGIKELDNLLPKWWVWLFYLTIAYSIGYVLYYHVFNVGDLQAAAYAKEQAAGDAIKAEAIAKFEQNLGSLTPSTDADVLATGEALYINMCAPCHRLDGGGLVGPNLCDTYWIHGSNYVDSLRIIINGVPEKGMITWRGLLKPSEITAVSSYIYQFRGTEPPNPKAPENEQAPEEENIYE